jgi:probable phosphoglycerate mutase
MNGVPGVRSRIYLIRHGETAWTISGRYTSRTDVPLTERGKRDARGLVAMLGTVKFSQVFTSPRQRARQTCELVGLGAAAAIEQDLAEWDYGDYEGKLALEIRRAHPDWNLFRDGCPGGESPSQISDRVDRLIVRLRSLEGDLALFSHGHLGRVLAARWIDLSVRLAQFFLLDTASLSILGYEHDLTQDPAVVLWNAVSGSVAEPVPNQRTGYGRAVDRWENEGGEVPTREVTQ